MKKIQKVFSFFLVILSLVVLSACKGNNEESDPTIIDPIEFSVSLNHTTRSIVQGDSFILTATLSGITEYDSIGWAAEGDLLTIAPNGLNAVITAGTLVGTETITVTVIKGDTQETASCVVTIALVELEVNVSTESITMSQGESRPVTVTVSPIKTQTVISWAENGSLLNINVSGTTATLTAGAATGTTSVTVTATIFGRTFEKVVSVTVNEIQPLVDISKSSVDVNEGSEVLLDFDFVTAYQSDKTFNISLSQNGIASAEVTPENKLKIVGLLEGEVTLTLSMTTNGVLYQDTLTIIVRPLGYVSVSGNTYDLFDMQLHFTESTRFSDIDEAIWQQYNIILGAGTNSGTGDRRGQFIFALHHSFVTDGDKDVIQVMSNGMSAIAVKIPDGMDNNSLAAMEFSMKLGALDPSFTGTWTLRFLIAVVVDGKTMLYAVDNVDNNGVQIGSLTISNDDLKREGYHTYRFNINQLPQNAGNYIIIYFGNTNNFNGVDGNRTHIESFNFLTKAQTGIELTTAPTKLQYVVGQNFDPAGMVVSSVYTVGNPVPINHSNLTFDYDFTTPGNKVVTVNYGSYSVDINVVVVEKALTSIVVTTQPDKKIYVAGEVFDPTGMVVTANYNDGTSVVIDDYTFNQDPLVAGAQSILLTYQELTASVSITVNSAVLTGISVTTLPTKTEYVVGQSATYQGIVVTATFADESTSVIPFNQLVFSGFNASEPVVGQVITVTYGGQTTTFAINVVEKVIIGIEVQRFPVVSYAVGQSADWSLLIINAVYNDGSKQAVSFENLVITGFDSTVEATVQITVSYLTFETAFNVIVLEQGGYVEVKTSDMQFKTEGLVTNTTYYDELFSGEEPASRDDYDVLLGRVVNSGDRKLQYSSTLITFTGEGDDRILNVNTNGISALAVRIPDGINPADITAFTFSMNAEHTSALATTVTFRPTFRFSSIFEGKEYFQGTNHSAYFLTQSASMIISHADYTRAGYHDYTVAISQPTLSGGLTHGNYIIMHMGNNGSFTGANALRINSFKFWTRDVVADMNITSLPTKTTYSVGETFAPAGLVVTPLYGINLYGASTTLSNASLQFIYDFSTAGNKIVTVKYGDITKEIEVTVIEKQLDSIEVTTLPDKVSYFEGDLFDPTGMVITARFNDMSSQVIDDYLFPTTPLVVGQESIEITYEGKTVLVPITVSGATIQSISVTTEPTKTTYIVGQSADYSGIVVTATYSDASTLPVAFEELIFTGFNASEVAIDQVITVTYGELSTTFMIQVVEKVAVGIQIQTLPKVSYLVDDVADFSLIQVVLVFNDESTEAIAFVDLAFDGFDSSVAGSVDVTVLYLTFNAIFAITVSEEMTNSDYIEILTSEMNFKTEGLVTNSTLYTNIFTGETPASLDDYDVLLGRVQNVTERPLQYSSTLIYFTGEGVEVKLVVNTNGTSALAVRIPEGLNPADITAFSFSMNGEHTSALANTVTFRPSFRFSSIFDGVEHFKAQATGTHSLPQSGALIITHADFTRAGYHDYTVKIDQPALAEGLTIGNYLMMYMGNNGSFSSANALFINSFKFWTKEVISDMTITEQPTKTTYEVGQTFDPTGLVVTPTYEVSIYGSPLISNSSLEFIYDFSTVGETFVTVKYGLLTKQIPVIVVAPEEPVEP
jgi:roadblock/LC7 domain-containing protein